MLAIQLIFLIFSIENIQTKFLLSSESSSIIVLRHLRLFTDQEFYRIRCPYHFNHLTVTLLNYSIDDCFDVYPRWKHDVCSHHQSPCRFHAKPIQMICHDELVYSSQVDITYQCSSSSDDKTNNNNNNQTRLLISSTPSPHGMTLHALTYPSNSSGIEEIFGMFLIGMIIVLILWLTVCCTWFIHCDHRRQREKVNHDNDDGQCEFLSCRPLERSWTLIDDRHRYPSSIVGNVNRQTHTGGLEHLSILVNPLEIRSTHHR